MIGRGEVNAILWGLEGLFCNFVGFDGNVDLMLSGHVVGLHHFGNGKWQWA